MINFIKNLSCLILFILFSCKSNAGPIIEAYENALQYDRQWKIAKSKIDESVEFLPQAKSQLLPSINLSNAVSNVKQQITNGSIMSPEQKYPAHTTALVLKQAIFRPRLVIGLDIAEAQAMQASFVYKEEEQQLLVRVISAYLDILQSEEIEVLTKSQINLSDLRLKTSTLAFKNGLGSLSELELAHVELERNKAQLLKFNQDSLLAKAKFEQITGKYLDKSRSMKDFLIDKNFFSLPTLTELIDKLEKNNFKLKASLKDVEISNFAFKQAGTGHYPTLDFYTQYSNNQGENGYFATSKTKNLSVGVQFNMSLYAGGLIDSQIRQARLRLNQSEDFYQMQKDDLNIKLKNEYYLLNLNIKNFEVIGKAIDVSTNILRLNEKGFLAGVTSNNDILKSEFDLYRQKLDYTKSKFEALVSFLKIKLLIGEINSELLVSIDNKFLIK